jgi:hypothetical protein
MAPRSSQITLEHTEEERISHSNSFYFIHTLVKDREYLAGHTHTHTHGGKQTQAKHKSPKALMYQLTNRRLARLNT